MHFANVEMQFCVSCNIHTLFFTLFHAGVHFAEILITSPGEILTSTNVHILSISYCKVIKTCRIGPHECPPSRGLFFKPICSGVVLVKVNLVGRFIVFCIKWEKYKNLGQKCTFFEVQSLDTY